MILKDFHPGDVRIRYNHLRYVVVVVVFVVVVVIVVVVAGA